MKLRAHLRNCLKKHALAPAAVISGLSPIVFSPTASGSDLMEVYQRAVQNDPQIREADANRLASRESKPQALAALLPQIRRERLLRRRASPTGRNVFTSD